MTGAGQLLVLVHGFAQSPASWREVQDLLPEDFRVATPELPGHGSTGLSLGDPSPELVRQLLADQIEAIGGKAVVWGYSQGARAAFDLALERPELVKALIIESGAPGIADPLARADRRSRDFALSKRLEKGSIEEFVGYWEAIPALGAQSRAVIEKQRPIRMAQDPVALAAALRGIGQAAYEPMWDRLEEITVPVLLMTGEEDEIYTARAEQVMQSLASARHVAIPSAGHSAHISQPEQAVAAVRDFLASI